MLASTLAVSFVLLLTGLSWNVSQVRWGEIVLDSKASDPKQLKNFEQPQDPGGPVTESEEEAEKLGDFDREYGPLVKQRELGENTAVTDGAKCDGPNCPYRQATLPGSRGYPGSFFPVEPIKNNQS